MVWNLEDDKAASVLDEVSANPALWGLLFWLPLMRRGDDPAIIARWKELVAALPDARRRGDLGTIVLVFAELAGRYVAWEQGLRDLNMTESQVVNRWIESAKTETELKRARADLLRIVNKRFPGQAAPDIVAVINSQPSIPLLDDWMDVAITAGTYDEFLAVVRR